MRLKVDQMREDRSMECQNDSLESNLNALGLCIPAQE